MGANIVTVPTAAELARLSTVGTRAQAKPVKVAAAEIPAESLPFVGAAPADTALEVLGVASNRPPA